MRHPLFRLCPVLLCCVGLPATAPAAPDTLVAALLAPECGIVFVANGCGGLHTASRGLQHAFWQANVPLSVESLEWSHGHGMFLLDHWNRFNHHTSARLLAERVLAYRRRYPGARVCLLGHSTGCALLLYAAEHLPPGSVDRMIFLSPAVSRDYDLHKALACACEGIDVYISHRDIWWMGLGMVTFGTADGRMGTGAGCKGFRVPDCTGPDVALYSRLRHHTWESTWSETGHTGGHYGNNHGHFLRLQVVPLLWPPPQIAPAPVPGHP